MTHETLYILTDHARQRVAERSLKEEWIERAFLSPDLLELDSDDPTKRHAFKVIPEYGDRVLHIVYNDSCTPKKIISAFFDRKRKGKV